MRDSVVLPRCLEQMSVMVTVARPLNKGCASLQPSLLKIPHTILRSALLNFRQSPYLAQQVDEGLLLVTCALRLLHLAFDLLIHAVRHLTHRGLARSLFRLAFAHRLPVICQLAILKVQNHG